MCERTTSNRRVSLLFQWVMVFPTVTWTSVSTRLRTYHLFHASEPTSITCCFQLYFYLSSCPLANKPAPSGFAHQCRLLRRPGAMTPSTRRSQNCANPCALPKFATDRLPPPASGQRTPGFPATLGEHSICERRRHAEPWQRSDGPVPPLPKPMPGRSSHPLILTTARTLPVRPASLLTRRPRPQSRSLV